MFLGEALHSSGHDTSKLFQPYSAPVALSSAAAAQRTLIAKSPSATTFTDGPKVAAENINGASFDLGSVDSSPGAVKKFVDLEEVSVKAFKAMLERTTSSSEQHRAEVVNVFKTTPFKQLCQEAQSGSYFQGSLNEILALVPLDAVEVPTHVEDDLTPPTFQGHFPEMFVY